MAKKDTEKRVVEIVKAIYNGENEIKRISKRLQSLQVELNNLMEELSGK